MRVLVLFEESQTVTKAFREAGHEAYSCDIQPCSGGHPEWHMQADIFDAMMQPFAEVVELWDLIIMHPPCTYLAVSGNRYYGKDKEYHDKRLNAIRHTKAIWSVAKNYAKRVCLENPVGVLKLEVKPQYIQPHEFGHDASKKTGLWLHNLPPLKETAWVPPSHGGRYYANQTPSGQNKLGPSPDRAKIRSKTYEGIAKAMADQWGSLT